MNQTNGCCFKLSRTKNKKDGPDSDPGSGPGPDPGPGPGPRPMTVFVDYSFSFCVRIQRSRGVERTFSCEVLKQSYSVSIKAVSMREGNKN